MQFFTRIVEFLRTPRGLLIAGVAGLIVILIQMPSCNRSKKPTALSSRPPVISGASSNLHITVSRPTFPVATSPWKQILPSRSNGSPVIFSVHIDLPAETNTVKEQFTVPFGRMLPVQLVNTLETLAPYTPIIGLVTEDLWHQGRLIIPAGSEVHGQAQLDRVRERITSSGSWIVVFQSGEQMTVNGVALDREFDANGSGWGITDGSSGIRGQVLRSGTLNEVKLFLATALSGVAAGFQETRSTALGSMVPSTARNAALTGTSAVLNLYAQQILEAIKRDGLFVRVPASKEFYLYINQPFVPFESGAATNPANFPVTTITNE